MDKVLVFAKHKQAAAVNPDMSDLAAPNPHSNHAAVAHAKMASTCLNGKHLPCSARL